MFIIFFKIWKAGAGENMFICSSLNCGLHYWSSNIRVAKASFSGSQGKRRRCSSPAGVMMNPIWDWENHLHLLPHVQRLWCGNLPYSYFSAPYHLLLLYHIICLYTLVSSSLQRTWSTFLSRALPAQFCPIYSHCAVFNRLPMWKLWWLDRQTKTIMADSATMTWRLNLGRMLN